MSKIITHHFRGFETQEEAVRFMQKHGGCLCHAQGRGLRGKEYRDLVCFAGLDADKYPYAVTWNEIGMIHCLCR